VHPATLNLRLNFYRSAPSSLYPIKCNGCTTNNPKTTQSKRPSTASMFMVIGWSGEFHPVFWLLKDEEKK
jgi:hypothetical protein